MKIKVDLESLEKFEGELNGISFSGIPLGGVIVSALLIELKLGNRDWSKMQQIKDRLAYYNLTYRRNRGVFFKGEPRKELATFGHGKGLFSFISSRQHLFGINGSIWSILEPHEKVAYIFSSSLLNRFDKADQENVIQRSDLPSVSFNDWKAEFLKTKKQLKLVIQAFLIDNGLPSFVGRRLLNKCIEQSQFLFFYIEALEHIKPAYFVVEHDRYGLTSPFVLAAKHLKIPTFTMMHGAVNHKFGYLPLLADKLLCWGSRQKILLEKYGAPKGSVAVVGAPQLKGKISIPSEDARLKFGSLGTESIMVLATNPMSLEQREKLLRMFCETIDASEDWKGLVRLHPSESLEAYSSFIQDYPNIIFDKNERFSLDETLSLADVVCIFNSAFGLDALLSGKAVIVLNVDRSSLGQGEDLIRVGRLSEICSTLDFKKFQESWSNDIHFRENYQSKVRTYAKSYCESFDLDAAKRTVDYIKSQLPRQHNYEE